MKNEKYGKKEIMIEKRTKVRKKKEKGTKGKEKPVKRFFSNFFFM